MKDIPLSIYGRNNPGEYFAVVDDADYGWARHYMWHARERHLKVGLYVTAERTINLGGGVSRGSYMHREIWERCNGPIPDGVQIDHIDASFFGALDNRKTNLRLATMIQQQGNRRRSEVLGKFRGVRKRNSKWEARICTHGVLAYLGVYDTPDEAARVYDGAARKHFGDFARLNFPEEAPA